MNETSTEGRIWINTLNVYEELGGKRKLIVYNFPNNIKISEKFKIKLPALIVGKEIIEDVNKEKLKKVYRIIEECKNE